MLTVGNNIGLLLEATIKSCLNSHGIFLRSNGGLPTSIYLCPIVGTEISVLYFVCGILSVPKQEVGREICLTRRSKPEPHQLLPKI